MKKYLLILLGLIPLSLFAQITPQRQIKNLELQLQEKLLNVFKDNRDGLTYKWVKIGTKIWMAENLQATKYNDSTAIPNVTDNTAWSKLTTGAYCCYNNDKANYGNTYGTLYNWFAVKKGKLCPVGWHVPSDAEWTTLENYLIANGYNYEGTTEGNKIAKSLTATTNWRSSTGNGAVGNILAANNKSGFSGLPGGYRRNDGSFFGIGSYGFWWSSTEYSASFAWYRAMNCSDTTVHRYFNYKERGFSVRCVRDD